MHFHLPKPMHGWREFMGEVGIIVIGVLIALGLEAVVDDLHWRSKVAEARTQLRHEIGNNLALMADRNSMHQCVDRRIKELAVVITKAGVSGRLPPLGPIGGPSIYTFPTSVWDSQMAAQTITHLPAEQLAAISRAYRFIGWFHESNTAEHAAWLTLNTMVGPGRPIDPASLSRLVEAMEAARDGNDGLFVPRAIDQVLVKGGLGANFPQLDPRNPPVLEGGTPLICRPIAKAPETY